MIRGHVPRRQPDLPAERRAAAGAGLGVAPDAARGALPDRRHDPPGRLDHRRARPQRGDGAAAGSRTRSRGGGARWRTRACSRPLATGRRASCRRGWTTATSCGRAPSVERWEDWLDAFAALGDRARAARARTPSTSGRRVTRRRGVAARRRRLSLRQVRLGGRCGARARRSPTARWPRSTPRTTTSTRRRSGSRRRSTAAAIVGNLRVPWYDERPAAGPADPRPRLDQGGVLAARERLPGARDGGAVARRPRPGRGRLHAADPPRLRGRGDGDARRARRRASTASARSGVSLGGYYAPRAATFEPRIKAVAGISGAFNFGALWESLPELTRETFAHKSGARRRRGRARAGAASSTSTACSSSSRRRRCSSPAGATG